MSRFAVLGTAVLAAAMLAAAPAAASHDSSGAFPSGYAFAYNDAYVGWPVAPVNQQHPLRGTLNDPRPGGYLNGVTIAVDDANPDPAAPAGRSHRVYAVESGVAQVPSTAGVGCVNRQLTVGHFQYWSVDPTVVAGQPIQAGDAIGWTCKSLYAMHLSEVQTLDGAAVYVNPLHAGGKLGPYGDSAAPQIRSLRFFAPADISWYTYRNALWSDVTGTELRPDNLRGLVDVRALIADPQSYQGFLAGSQLAVALAPHKVRLTVREAGGSVVADRVVFQSDFHLAHPGFVDRDSHFAPGTRQNLGPTACLEAQPQDCQGAQWFRLFATSSGRYWDTSQVKNGAYSLTVQAWDLAGSSASHTVDVRVK
jgi:hypothetical protein